MGKMVDAHRSAWLPLLRTRSAMKALFSALLSGTQSALGAIVGLIVMFYAYVAPHLVPHGVKLDRNRKSIYKDESTPKRGVFCSRVSEHCSLPLRSRGRLMKNLRTQTFIMICCLLKTPAIA